MNKSHNTIFKLNASLIIGCLLFICSIVTNVSAGTLSCSITTALGCTGTIVLRMSSTSNATAELPTLSGSAFANDVICCTGVSGLVTSCAGSHSTVLNLSSSTNAHVEQSSLSNYSTSTCLSVSVGTTSIAYQSSNCTGYDTTLGSMSSTTNAHIGNASAYTTKICGSGDNVAPPQTITFSISTSTVNFGSVDSSTSRYASSTGQGSGTEVEAHTISIATNATNGFIMTVQGQTLTASTNSAFTINAIGGVNTASTPGTEQFGLRIATSSGTGLITSPYAASGFAYAATATTTSQVASGLGDDVTTVYSIRYVVNMTSVTDPASYSARLVYVATANF